MATSRTLMDMFQPAAKRFKAVSPSPPSDPSKSLPKLITTVQSSHDLTPDQKSRMEFNKSLAKSRRNLKICSERIAHAIAGEGNLPLNLKLEGLLVEETWLEALPGEFQKPYAKKLCEFVESELSGSVPVYPPPHMIFNALNSTSFDRVKAVIIGQIGHGKQKHLPINVFLNGQEPTRSIQTYKGHEARHSSDEQNHEILEVETCTLTDHTLKEGIVHVEDPYHGPGQAMGLSFSVPEGVKVPSSLVNIYKELQQDLKCSIPSHGNLERWAVQGVLMLNAVLTAGTLGILEGLSLSGDKVEVIHFGHVRQHQANSHAKKGWEQFTDAVIDTISKNKKGVVFLLWGNYAQAKSRLIDETKHHILNAAHPSGLSANRGFFGCRFVFSLRVETVIFLL
ncbi:hypothetical protein RJ640_006298 [Escallonia rubra]|uniref:Uracil-DNA glycosylase-like domain-containing protein n=1 Tax=Escallonia rubra TaxID=112253 RepID=A0AA88UD91_9ASTE|nr:hypothetical protein RJ640_006298 [Escallonia rubra]